MMEVEPDMGIALIQLLQIDNKSGSLKPGVEAESYTRPDKGKAGGVGVAIDLPTNIHPVARRDFLLPPRAGNTQGSHA